MPLLTAILSLLFPQAVPPPVDPELDEARQARTEAPGIPAGEMADRSPGWHSLVEPARTPIVNQVRIERRVILRINPQPSRTRSMLAQLPRQASPAQLVERPMGQCLPASGIVGVQDSGSRLIIYMRDRSLISAELEKACSPRDFYLGFYVERSADGQLCADRDRLLSRAGAKCRISELNRLVAIRPQD